MPFGNPGKEFVKSLTLFGFKYPKTALTFGVFGFVVPMAQKGINEQTEFERKAAEFERKAANDQIVFEKKQIAFDSMQARLKKTELNEQFARYGELKHSACTPGSAFDKDLCQGYTEVFKITLAAVKESL